MTESPTPPQFRSNSDPLARRLSAPFRRFLEIETSSAILLVGATLLALGWANSPWSESYEHLLHTPLALSVGSFAFSLSLHAWISDALMAIFFFVVGMEIKRELVYGELSTRDKAMLPVAGALGGMVVPAGIYAWLHLGGPAIHGWGIPMATDIAFAVAALSVFGSRVPSGLKVFLLALAIADDLGAVAVIAIFYTAEVSLGFLGLAAAGLVLCLGLNQIGVRSFAVYWVVGAAVWWATHESGVHATVAGVLLGFITPTALLEPTGGVLDRARDALESLRELMHVDRSNVDPGGHTRHVLVQRLGSVSYGALSPLDRLTNGLEPYVAYLIMPVFAFANAGVHLEAATLGDPMGQRVGLAVVLGLLLGKPVGITLFSWIAVRTGLATLPRGVDWSMMWATGLLAGIGFTVALFITNLAFESPVYVAGAKVGILFGSLVATVLGVSVLARNLGARDRAAAAARASDGRP